MDFYIFIIMANLHSEIRLLANLESLVLILKNMETRIRQTSPKIPSIAGLMSIETL